MDPLATFEEFEVFLGSFTNYERRRQFRYDPETVPLSRMRSFVEQLGSPQRSFPVVHVTGSKGKGSTTLMLEALLDASGLVIGTYTSPHVDHLRERIRWRRDSIAELEIVRLTNSALPVLERSRATAGAFPTFFELMTGLAMLHFAQKPVDQAIFEVGLGGRLDATNVIDAPIAAITSIGLEHTRVLGSTLGDIAREKAGIIKDDATVVVGPLDPGARSVVAMIAAERRARVIGYVDPGSVRPAGAEFIIQPFSRDPIRAPAIRGPALRANLALALELYRLVLAKFGVSPDPRAIELALAELRLPGRVEFYPGPPAVLIDGAHTAESFAILELALNELEIPEPRSVVFSIAADKNVEPILEIVRRLGDEIYWTAADPARSLDPEELRSRTGVGRTIESPEEAIAIACRKTQPVVICGSLYLAGIARRALAPLLATVPRAIPAP